MTALTLFVGFVCGCAATTAFVGYQFGRIFRGRS